MKLLEQICSLPTAPFAEHLVKEYVRRFAARRRIPITADRFGNLLLQLRGSKRIPRIVFVTHMDHPGLIAREMIGPDTLDADFRGGVLSDFVDGARVRFHDSAGEAAGIITHIIEPSAERAEYPGRVRVRISRPVDAGSPGLFDLGNSRVKGGKFYSRVCDNLAGVAAALSMLDNLRRCKLQSPVAVLLTRGEEEGFIGALAAVIHRKLLRDTDRIVSIECSAKQSYAQQGDGVIIRVGDRTSVFDSGLTAFLTARATLLASKDNSFRYQRCLMPGGTCEATVFDAYGYTAAAACVPLGNYHNMDKDAEKIAPEYIDLNDWNNMVRLFIDVAKNAGEFAPGMMPLRTRLEKRFALLREKLS